MELPLAIFTGQIAAALAAGNAVLAKPAEQTPLIAAHAVALLRRAGVPETALQLLPGDGSVGALLTRDPRVNGVAFTGSTDTARLIRKAMADHLDPTAPLIAETGGMNAMVVDSTALPEQAVRDILASAFQSAGQRCSALRCLYVQDDIADTVTEMLFGAMEELTLGNPWHLATDVGPVIDAEAQAGIAAHVEAARRDGRLLKQLPAPQGGTFIGPAVIRVPGIAAMKREIFGPVLHLATFKAGRVAQVIRDINASGYGLTFGLHTASTTACKRLISALQVGNAYVNRNQIGAVVGSQPFGGEGHFGHRPQGRRARLPAPLHARPAPAAGQPGPATPPAEAARRLAATPRPRARAAGPARPHRRIEPPAPCPARAPLLCLGPAPRRRWPRPKRCAASAAARSRRPTCRPRCWRRWPASPARCGGAMPPRPRPGAGAGPPRRPAPAADRRPARPRPRLPRTPRLHRHHRLGRQRQTPGRRRRRLTGGEAIAPLPRQGFSFAPCVAPGG